MVVLGVSDVPEGSGSPASTEEAATGIEVVVEEVEVAEADKVVALAAAVSVSVPAAGKPSASAT